MAVSEVVWGCDATARADGVRFSRRFGAIFSESLVYWLESKNACVYSEEMLMNQYRYDISKKKRRARVKYGQFFGFLSPAIDHLA